MTYIFYTLLSGIISGAISVYFRYLELKREVILMPKHLATQIMLFAVFALIFSEYYSQISIDLGFVQFGWFVIYFLFSSVSYYAVQVFYEFYTGNTLFPKEEEMKQYIEKLEREREQ